MVDEPKLTQEFDVKEVDVLKKTVYIFVAIYLMVTTFLIIFLSGPTQLVL